jgi:hypothetical protein
METKQLSGLSKYLFRADGEVISLWKTDPCILAGGTDKDGYKKFVLIDDNGMRRYMRRASLICTAFHGQRPFGMNVRHLDGSRTNDAASNLCWGTQSENCMDKVLHGTAQRGHKSANSKITEKQAAKIKMLLAQGNTANTIKDITGVPKYIIYNIKYKKAWVWVAQPDIFIEAKRPAPVQQDMLGGA